MTTRVYLSLLVQVCINFHNLHRFRLSPDSVQLMSSLDNNRSASVLVRGDSIQPKAFFTPCLYGSRNNPEKRRDFTTLLQFFTESLHY